MDLVVNLDGIIVDVLHTIAIKHIAKERNETPEEVFTLLVKDFLEQWL